MPEPELKLIRFPNEHNEFTEGELFRSNKHLFDTLEDPIRDLNGDGDLLDEGESKIYGDTAIPQGTYELEVTYSNRFKRQMVHVKNVKHFEGIRMHWGATKENTQGCILGGKRISPGRLANSNFTSRMVEIILEIIEKAQKCYLMIM